jgi:hypothetical protein
MSVSATTTTTTVVVALLLVIDIPFMVSTPPSQFFLTDRDFANALRLSVNRHRHRSSLLVNDMRIQVDTGCSRLSRNIRDYCSKGARDADPVSR